MVYCGKPSKGCHACRARKTRCDANPDGCGQCAKARRICPGYRSTVDVIFRDQSENVIQKAKASEARRMAAASVGHESQIRQSNTDSEEHPANEQTILAVSRSFVDGGFTMLPTLDERATCHFLSQYIVGIQAPSRGILDNLTFMHQHCSFDDTLTTAVKAISLASFAHHARSTQLEQSSRHQYTKAISLVNNSLRDPDASVKHTTLFSILILGMYETITGVNQRSISNWIQHVRGSAALLKLRGVEQLDTPIGRRLFVQANTGILTTSVQLNIPIPKAIMEMTRSLPDKIPANDDFAQRAYKIHISMLDFNQWRAAVGNKKITNPHLILARALELDQRLAEIYDEPTPEWAYHTVYSATNDAVFDGYYQVYPDLLTANLWNAVRVMRGLLHEELRATLLKGFAARPPVFDQPHHTAQFQLSTDICYQVQAEIFASVPQHLGYVTKPGNLGPDPNTMQQSGSSTVDPAMFAHSQASKNPTEMFPPTFEPRASGGLNLMWPLFFAGSMDLSSAEGRAYSVKILRKIGDEMGIRQAWVLAKISESKTDVEAWSEQPRVTEDDDDNDMGVAREEAQ